MPTRRAVANGNWSSTSTWNGGIVPTDGDTVYSNGFNITLDVDVLIGGANNPIVNTGSLVSGQWYEIVNVGGQNWTTIGAASNSTGTVFQSTGTGTAGNLGTARALATLTTATNTAAGATTGGGVFTMSTVRAINTDIRAGTTTCLNVTATSGTLTLSGIRVVGGSVAGSHGIVNSSTAIIDCTGGALISAGTASGVYALINNSTGQISATGTATFVGGTGGALNNASTGSITISGSCTFTGGSNSNSHTLANSSTGSVTITGSCTFTGGSVANTYAMNNISTGTITVSGSCTFTGGAMSQAINNNSIGTLIITNSTFTASTFTNAINIANTSADVRLSGDFLDHWSGWKAVSGQRWRLGTAPTLGQTRYALAGTTDSYFTEFGSDYGSFGNPIAANVRSGVVYGGGNLTGTCAVPAAGSVAFGVPVDNTTGTAVLTPAAIRAELATELGRIDAAISSRLAPNGTLATVTNLTNAPASVTPADIWSHPARTITGGTVNTLTNAPTVPSASAIAGQVRTELTPELEKVAALNPERLGQCVTTNILGTLLAQANS